MGSKITLTQFAQQMSEHSGFSVRECEAFLKSLFRNIGSGLETDGIVKIKEIGTFKLLTVASRKSVDVNTGVENEIPSHRKVSFIPSKELAAAVNAPFEMFDTVEISEDIDDAEIMRQESDVEAESPQYTSETPDTDLSDDNAEPADASSLTLSSEAEHIVSDNSANPADSPANVGQSSVGEVANSDNREDTHVSIQQPTPESDMDAADTVTHVRHRGFGHGFAWGIIVSLLLLVVGAGILYFMFRDRYMIVDGKEQVETVSDIPEMAMSVIDEGENQLLNIDDGEPTVMEDADMAGNTVPTVPSDPEPVYDTITDTRYLTTVAKEHYGNYHLWPYIYKENSKILGHPNRIRPGTRIVVPDLKKYGVDASNPRDIERAKKLGAEIYSRYQ